MKVTIVGGGKVGFYLAKTLLEHDHEITIIDRGKAVCKYLANALEIPTVICGDGTQIEVLERAGLRQSDAMICVTGADEVNLIACQLAKKMFYVSKTVAKVNNPKNAEVLKALGVDNVINSTDSITSLLEREVDSTRIRQVLSLNHGEASLSELTLPEKYKLHGISLQKLGLPDKYNIVSISRQDTLIVPRGMTELHGGDILLVISDNTSLHDLMDILRIEA